MWLNLKRLAAKIRQPQNEKGQGLVEYALILVLVAIVVIAVLLTLGPVVSGVYAQVICGLNGGQCIGPYTYGSDVPTVAEACAMMKVNSGDPIYGFTTHQPAPHDGDEAWWSTSKAPPTSNVVYAAGNPYPCP